MRAYSILYVGPNSGTSRQRALALERLGHRVFIIDPRRLLPEHHFAHYWVFHTGALFLGKSVAKGVIAGIPPQSFDLAWIDGGDLITPELVRELKRRVGPILSYNIDDPFGGRDGRKWRNYLRSIPLYDLLVVLRDCNVAEAKSFGAHHVMRVFMSADEVAHRPRALSFSERERWASEVSFTGTWMPERGPFLASLIKLGIPLSIYGDRWQKAPEWPILKSAWRGPGVYDEEDYAKVVSCSKICIGLLSKGNRDMSTTRSFEIPLLGTVLCAERTDEHSRLYREDKEAVFWSSVEECAEKCRMLLGDDHLRERIARAGHHRCLQNQTTNEPILERILSYWQMTLAGTRSRQVPMGALRS